MTTSNTTIVPARSALEERLEAIRTRIFRVQGICGTSAEAAQRGDAVTGQLDRDTAVYIWQALEFATETLDSIAAALDPAVMLNPAEVQS